VRADHERDGDMSASANDERRISAVMFKMSAAVQKQTGVAE